MTDTFRTAPMRDGIRYDSRGEPILAGVDTPQEYLELYQIALDRLHAELGPPSGGVEHVARNKQAKLMVEAYYRGRLDRRRIEAAR